LDKNSSYFNLQDNNEGYFLSLVQVVVKILLFKAVVAAVTVVLIVVLL
jgi:hypothetical protein